MQFFRKTGLKNLIQSKCAHSQPTTKYVCFNHSARQIFVYLLYKVRNYRHGFRILPPTHPNSLKLYLFSDYDFSQVVKTTQLCFKCLPKYSPARHFNLQHQKFLFFSCYTARRMFYMSFLSNSNRLINFRLLNSLYFLIM